MLGIRYPGSNDFSCRQPDPSEDEDTDASQTILVPIRRLTNHLNSLASSLPSPTAISLYRRIAGHISNHILQRQVLYRGRSRMSLKQGRAVLGEANLWVEGCRRAMFSSGLRRADGPWERLLEAGHLLSLDEETFLKVVNTARLGNEKRYEELAETYGFTEMSANDALAVLNAREDFPR